MKGAGWEELVQSPQSHHPWRSATTYSLQWPHFRHPWRSPDRGFRRVSGELRGLPGWPLLFEPGLQRDQGKLSPCLGAGLGQELDP